MAYPSAYLIAIGIGIIAIALISCFGIGILNYIDNLQFAGFNINLDELNLNKGIRIGRIIINTSIPAFWAMFSISILILIGGTWLFRNIVPAILAGLALVLIPFQVAYRKRRKSQIDMLNELATVVRNFADYYEQTGQLMAALDFVGKNTPTRAGKCIKTAYSRLIYGVEEKKVLDNLAKNLDVEYGYVFVDLLKQARLQGSVTTQLFYNLSDRISDEQELMNESIQETAFIKTFNLIMAILPLPIFIILQRMIPGVSEWLTQSLAGRVVVSGCFLSVIAWFFVERVVDEF